ncbi:alkaline phosphatase D family protein [Roseomonas sp. NAR14]|uniref:Alkaline phosphatase D family protein n=1 Tax=Roseomonas acroporae TaxID=2937791 RepID=A0A9X2BSM1_9PROT|nr:alkaline phosphatase D family protein [Roseomonas acroporae]MCK8783718.1 alkaline phosphatase D family protein [Roseomonas acroporae]
MTRFRLTRRATLAGATLLGTGLGARLSRGQGIAAGSAPAVIPADATRPRAEWGAMAGDVAADRALIWSRADRTARMLVEWSPREDFANAQRLLGPHATEASDFTARLDLRGLPADSEIFYRVSFLDLDSPGAASAPVTGRFRTVPRPGAAGTRDVRFLWSGDTVGQGWGIDESRGGMTTYETMRRTGADFFIHCGDTIYADGPLQAEVRMADGSTWRNLVTPEKSKVAETLAEFRGNHRYNLLDRNVRAFHAEVAQIWMWDDHEVTNNWSDSKDLTANPAYAQKHIRRLSANATRAFLDYAPIRGNPDEPERVYRRIAYGPHLDLFMLDMRSYRGPNSFNRQERPGPETAFLGAEQLAWLRQGLRDSRATWKVVAADMPIGLQVPDGRDPDGRPRFEAIANGDGPPLGRELEIAALLSGIRQDAVRNVVWLTADVHYTAAHHYHPDRARFRDFAPFWEFVSGPLWAGGFGPNPLDDTFGPAVVWQKAPGRDNAPPGEGTQFFGQCEIEGASGNMTVLLKDLTGAVLWRRTLEPERG